MTRHTLPTWLAALALALLLSALGPLLDGIPDDLGTERLVADDAQAAIQSAQATARTAREVQQP